MSVKKAVEDLILAHKGNIGNNEVQETLIKRFPTLKLGYVRLIRSGLTKNNLIPRLRARAGGAVSHVNPQAASASADNVTITTILDFMDAVRPFGNFARVKYLCDKASELANRCAVASR